LLEHAVHGTEGGSLPVGVTRQSIAERGQQRHHEVSSRPEERAAHEPSRAIDQNYPEPLVAQPALLSR